MTAAIFPVKSCMTCSAMVGLGFPEVFAEGPTIGTPALAISSSVTLLSGILNAAVSNPPVTVFERTPGCNFRISVNEPGQNAVINFITLSESGCAYFLTVSRLATCTINGLSLGRPFAAYTRLTASSLVASAPNP